MALNPRDFACTDGEHYCTRVLCECEWFDGRCHECDDATTQTAPPCMEPCGNPPSVSEEPSQ